MLKVLHCKLNFKYSGLWYVARLQEPNWALWLQMHQFIKEPAFLIYTTDMVIDERIFSAAWESRKKCNSAMHFRIKHAIYIFK